MNFGTINTLYVACLICILSFIFGFLFWTDFRHTSIVISIILSAGIRQNKSLTTSDSKISLFDGYNGTHLWLWKLADESHFQVANEIPCRTVEYGGVSSPNKINSCDKSSTNEFSLQHLLQGQKWIYEHQHPIDCSNKRFAIIHETASSGFGSTIHQIAWALAVALSEDRIAVYKSPGNWVYIGNR